MDRRTFLKNAGVGMGMITVLSTLIACNSTPEQVLTSSPIPHSSRLPTKTINPVVSPTSTITPLPLASPTPKPNITPDGQHSIYVNDTYGYQLRYPAGATLIERGVESFPTNELPVGMTADEYLNQLRSRYGDKLCVSVKYQLGYILLSAPPNLNSRYVHCGVTGVGDYEVVATSEEITLEGQAYTAEGWEVVGPDETLAHHYEFFRVRLPDATVIEYGSWPSATATYADYLKMKSELLKIVSSYTQIQ